MPGPIRIDPDMVLGELKRLIWDLEGFPSAVEVAMSEGGSTEATEEFRQEVRDMARALSWATGEIATQINELHSAMTAVVHVLAENDASIADESNSVLAILDSAAATVPEDQSVESDKGY